MALASADGAALREATGAVFGAGAGFPAGGATAATGAPVPSAWSPRTENVLILRGSLFGSVPLLGTGPALATGTLLGATLATEGGLPFGFSGGNTTRTGYSR